MEDAMTKAIDPSATSNANQQHNTQRRLLRTGSAASKLFASAINLQPALVAGYTTCSFGFSGCWKTLRI